MTPAEIDARRRATPLFRKALATEQRLSSAIALNTIFTARLRDLRGTVRKARATYNDRELAGFLNLWGDCFNSWIASANRAAEPKREAA